LEINDNSEIVKIFIRKSRFSSYNINEKRKISFTQFLKRQSAESLICEGKDIIKIDNDLLINPNNIDSSNIDNKLKICPTTNEDFKIISQNNILLNILNDDLLKLNTIEENTLNQIALNESKLVDLRGNEVFDKKITYDVCYNTDFNSIKNENYDENKMINESDFIKNKNDSFKNELSSNKDDQYCLGLNNSENRRFLKKPPSFNSSFERISDNNSNCNEKLDAKFILESPNRPRKDTISHKTHLSILSNYLNVDKTRSLSKQEIIFDDNRSVNQLDSNFKLKNTINEEQDNVIDTEIIISDTNNDRIKLKTFKSSDNIINVNFSAENFNCAIQNTNISTEEEIFKEFYKNEGEEINKINKIELFHNDNDVSRNNINGVFSSIDNIVEQIISSNVEADNYFNNNNIDKEYNLKKSKIKKEKEIFLNENTDIYHKQNQSSKSSSDKRHNYNLKSEFNKNEELFFENENMIFNCHSKPYFKLTTINEELESNQSSINMSAKKNSNNYENNLISNRKYTSKKNIIKLNDQFKFQNEDYRKNINSLILDKEEIKKFFTKKCKSLDNYECCKIIKKISFDELDLENEML